MFRSLFPDAATKLLFVRSSVAPASSTREYGLKNCPPAVLPGAIASVPPSPPKLAGSSLITGTPGDHLAPSVQLPSPAADHCEVKWAGNPRSDRRICSTSVGPTRPL